MEVLAYNDINGKKRKSLFGSVTFRAWLAFLVLALCVLFFFWMAGLIIFSTNFTKMCVTQLSDNSASLYSTLKNNQYSTEATSFRNAAKDCAESKRMTVIVFSFPDGADSMNPYEAHVEYFTNPTAAELNVLVDFQSARAIISDKFLLNMSSVDASGKFVYASRSGAPINITYGQKIVTESGKTLYLYTSTTVIEYDATMTVLTTQMKTVTLICVLFSVLMSLLIAWQFSRPIREFTGTAKKIGDGDLTQKYKGNGYNEFDELADALNYATAEMVKAESFRRDFLTNVTHDLRTPLTLVKANAEMIRDISGENKDKRNRNIQIIINEVDRLTSLVEDILDLSKLQSGAVEMKDEKVAISELAAAVISQFDVFKQGGYDLVSEITPGLNVSCDRRRLNQVLYNLIGNAINYVGEDKQVIVRVKKTDLGVVRAEISDHGKGIPEEEIDKVWERYYRSNQNRRNVVGSGIGLSIVKNILLSFNARYGIISKQGEGTTFWFELPLVSEEKPDGEDGAE